MQDESNEPRMQAARALEDHVGERVTWTEPHFNDDTVYEGVLTESGAAYTGFAMVRSENPPRGIPNVRVGAENVVVQVAA